MKSGKSIFKLSRSQWTSIAVLASSLGVAAAVTLPFPTFTAGTPISASQVNANFAALANAQLSAADSATAVTALSVTAVELLGIDFTCPADGFVLAQGHTVVDITHVAGTGENVFVKLSTAVETGPGGLGWTQAVALGAWPSSGGVVRLPTSVSSRFACTGGVAARYRINASLASGATAQALFHVLVLNYSSN
jgi:hypothetical protein